MLDALRTPARLRRDNGSAPASASSEDDIDCVEFLRECGLQQYQVVLLKNCGASDGTHLSRRRLALVRGQADLCAMNVRRFDHQKALMLHIRETLRFPQFRSPLRHQESSFRQEIEELQRKEASAEAAAAATTTMAAAAVAAASAPNSADGSRRPSVFQPSSRRSVLHSAGAGSMLPLSGAAGANRDRRKSFDEAAWSAIHGLRAQASDEARFERLDRIRDVDGLVAEPVTAQSNEDSSFLRRQRRWTMDHESRSSHVAAGRAYGDQALQLNILRSQLAKLERDVLDEFRSVANCERASILFMDNRRMELVLLLSPSAGAISTRDVIRFPSTQGAAGYAATSGEVVNMTDCYSDSRFNQSVDKLTGHRTRCLLCAPIRSRMGGGRVIAVLELINKLGAPLPGSTLSWPVFGSDEERLVQSYALRVADELENRFLMLLGAYSSLVSRDSGLGNPLDPLAMAGSEPPPPPPQAKGPPEPPESGRRAGQPSAIEEGDESIGEA